VNPALSDALQEARRSEKAQALFYRALAAEAELAGDAPTAEDLNGLHADEQHHLSRLTARLIEAEQQVADLSDVQTPDAPYPDWQETARLREQAEIECYEKLTRLEPDAATAELIGEIIAVERKHADTLGGKYMNA
jgi:rubrerythrin